MRKKLLYIFLVIPFLGISQIFTENFEAGFPGAMVSTNLSGTVPWTGNCQSTTNSGGALCPISGVRSATFFVNSYADNIGLLTTPTLNLSNGAYLLKFKHIQRSWSGDINDLFIRISTDNGANWAIVTSYDIDVQNATERIVNLAAFNPTSTTKIQFAVVNNWGYSTILDDISVVLNTTQNDVFLQSENLNDIIVAGNKTISGIITNEGGNNITSMNINYQINNDAIQTQVLSGLNLTPGQTYTYSHNISWNASPGSYNLKVWVSQPNGANDSNVTNNEILKTVIVATGSTTYKPLYEKFTSSTCGPCASFNSNVFNNFFSNNNSNFCLINYQVNWPGSGDPYYTAEVGNRVGFYGVNGAPTLFINGRGATTSTSGIQTELTSELNKPAFFGLTATSTINHPTSASVTYTIMPYISGNYTVRAVVIEKITTSNTGTNGETSFKNVTMKMIPDASGTIHNFIAGQSITNTITTSMSGTNVEEASDLDVVVFIQNNTTKEVYQSQYTSSFLSSPAYDLSSINVYPNPTNGLINFNLTENASINIYDISGKNVLTSEGLIGPNQVELSNFESGMYIMEIIGENTKQIRKISKF